MTSRSVSADRSRSSASPRPRGCFSGKRSAMSLSRRRGGCRAAAASGGKEEAARAAREPLAVVERALEAEAPHFVDFVDQTLDERYPGLTTMTTEAAGVYTTLDLHLQRLAQDAVRNDLPQVDKLLSRRKR